MESVTLRDYGAQTRYATVPSRRSDWAIFGAILTILLLCYSPVLLIPFGFYDDYFVLRDALTGNNRLAVVTRIAGGRPIHALLTYLAFVSLHDISELRRLRFIAVILIALVGWSVYRTFVYAGWRRYWAGCISLIIVTLPPFEVDASWALAISYPVAALTSAAAFYFAEKAVSARGDRHRIRCIGASTLLMLLSVTNYQPAAMFFWVFAVIVIFKPNVQSPITSRRLAIYALVTYLGLALGFVVYKLGLATYGSILPPGRTRLAESLVRKLSWFLQWPLRDALNLASIWQKGSVALAVAVFILGGLILYFKELSGGFWVKMTLALFILPFSYLPNLVTFENWSAYRTELALTSIVAVYFFFALQGYASALRDWISQRVVSGTLSLCVVVSALLAASNVYNYFALPQILELDLIRSQLADGNWTDAREVYVFGCHWQDSIAPSLHYDEFGFPSCSQPWIPQPEVYLVLREMDRKRAELPITVAPAQGVGPPAKNAVLVDMRKLSSVRP